jgi:hypothetical protein
METDSLRELMQLKVIPLIPKNKLYKSVLRITPQNQEKLLCSSKPLGSFQKMTPQSKNHLSLESCLIDSTGMGKNSNSENSAKSTFAAHAGGHQPSNGVSPELCLALRPPVPTFSHIVLFAFPS